MPDDVLRVPLGSTHIQSDPATLQGRPNAGKYGGISDNLAILIWIRKAKCRSSECVVASV